MAYEIGGGRLSFRAHWNQGQFQRLQRWHPMTLILKEEQDEERGTVANWVLHAPPSHSIPRALQCCAACILLQNPGQLASMASHINKQRSCSHTHVIAIHVTKKSTPVGLLRFANLTANFQQESPPFP